MPATTHELIGRDEELAEIIRLLDREQLPVVALLYGLAGIGKTSLWLAAIKAARERDYRVLSSRPSEADTQLSYAGLADLLDDVAGDVLPRLPPIQQRALRAALLLGEVETPVDRRAVAAAFLGALRSLAADRPICLAIDDVQWLDAASLAALRYALARLDREPVAGLVVARGSPPPWLRRSVPERGLATLEITGLSLGATRQLLHERLDASFPRPTLVRLWEISGGNPFFALELASALRRRGGTPSPVDPLPIPSSLDDLLRERLDSLGPAALEVAGVAAAAGDPTTDLVEAALGAPFEAGLAEALDGRILELDGDRLRFTHPLLGSAVAARQTPSHRRALHARLAEVAPSAEERARHLALATVAPNPEIAAILEDAGQTALSRGAPAAAAELAEHAHRLTPAVDAGDAARRLLVAASRNHGAGDSTRALLLVDQARRESVPGAGRAAILLLLAELQYDVVGPCEPLDTYLQALTEASGDPVLESNIHHGMAMSLRHTGPAGEGLEHARAAVAAASRTADAALECRAQATYCLLHFDAGFGVPHAALEKALELEKTLPAPRELLATQTLAHLLAGSGDLDRARSSFLTVLSEWEERDEPYQYDPLFNLALLELRAGNWQEAARNCDRAIELLNETGRDGVLPILDLPRASLAALLGRLEEARGRCERGLAGTTGNLLAQAMYRQTLGFIELSGGDHRLASDHLRQSYALGDELGLREPGMRTELGDLLEALIATGERDDAETVLAAWEPRAAALDRARNVAILARGRGLLHAARGDLDGAFGSLQHALAQHQRSADPFEQARTLLALGRTQRRAKKRAAARATLEDALTRFETLGAALWAKQTRAELARIGGRAPSHDELTEAERRIAHLVAEGRTNRDVAAALYLTNHSVETALTRIYRKLGVRSRTELAHRLGSNS